MSSLQPIEVALFTCVLIAAAFAAAQDKKTNIRAQQLVDSLLSAHPELESVELSSTPPRKTACITIAATETKEVGARCDKDERTAMKTKQPFVESEIEKGNRVWDVTAPLHDASGNLIGTVGMDVKPASGQTRESVLKLTEAVVRELEPQIPSKAALFEPAKP